VPTRQRRLTSELKVEAVKPLTESGKSLRQVAAELGVDLFFFAESRIMSSSAYWRR